MSGTSALTTSEAIDLYLRTLDMKGALALASAVESVRALLPDCDLADEELVEILAAHAIYQGFSVIIFDLNAKRYELELAVDCHIPGASDPRRGGVRG